MVGYVGLGSNLGDRGGQLRFAVESLPAAGIATIAISSVWETEPVDCDEPLWFLNMAAKIETSHSPWTALAILQRIERAAGRVASRANAPRRLDLDLLWLGGLTIEDERLTLPHPRMWRRAFVLAPLAEVGAGLRNPATGRTVAEERRHLPDGAVVRRLGPLAPVGALPL